MYFNLEVKEYLGPPIVYFLVPVLLLPVSECRRSGGVTQSGVRLRRGAAASVDTRPPASQHQRLYTVIIHQWLYCWWHYTPVVIQWWPVFIYLVTWQTDRSEPTHGLVMIDKLWLCFIFIIGKWSWQGLVVCTNFVLFSSHLVSVSIFFLIFPFCELSLWCETELWRWSHAMAGRCLLHWRSCAKHYWIDYAGFPFESVMKLWLFLVADCHCEAVWQV